MHEQRPTHRFWRMPMTPLHRLRLLIHPPSPLQHLHICPHLPSPRRQPRPFSRFLRPCHRRSPRLHSCSHVWTNSALVLAMVWMSIAGLRNQWRMFVSLGVITQSVMVFRVLAGLVSDSLYVDPSGATYTPPDLFRDLSVLAFTVFACVYLARSFPRVVQIDEATPPPNPFP
jgi:hypothetical protein